MDPRIPLSVIPRPSIMEGARKINADIAEQQIRQQDRQLRAQEIEMRRRALEQKNTVDPIKQQKELLDLNLTRAEAATRVLRHANAGNWATIRPILAGLVGEHELLTDDYPGDETIKLFAKQGEDVALQLRGEAEKADPLVQTMGPDGKGVYTRTSQAEGQEPYHAPTAQGAGSDFHQFLTHFAAQKGKTPDTLTTPEYLQAKKEFGQADDRPSVTVRLPGSGMTPGQEFNATRQLRNDYERETKAARTVQQQLALMKSSLATVKKPGGAAPGSQGVLVTFQKILDPTSVVRESEYARSAAGLSLMSRLEGSWMKISQGGAGVTVKDLEQFVNLAESFATNQRAFADQSRNQINAMAKRYGLDPDSITRDIDPSAPSTPAPAPKANPFRKK